MPESANARYLEPAQLRASRIAEGAAPRVEIEDRTVLRAQFRRLFPLSHPDQYIAVQDAGKNEVGVLRTLEGMDADSRQILEEELDRRYFTPSVRRIHTLVQEGGMWRFEVETVRGPATYYVRNWRDSAHEMGPNRWLVHSVDGQRFEIPNTDTLDVRSNALLEQLL